MPSGAIPPYANEPLVPVDLPPRTVSGMHRSFHPVAPPRSKLYLTINVKFALSCAFALIWLGFSIWISIPWIEGLATHISLPAAIIVVSLLAFLPGVIVALLFAGLLLDRQPAFRITDPITPVTVLIAARNEEAAIAGTLDSLAEQDYAGVCKVILIDNGSTDATSQVARATADANGMDLTVLSESVPGKNNALNTGLANTNTEITITVDADTLLQKSAIRLLISRLESSPQEVVAVAGTVLVRNTRNGFWTRVQTYDYLLGIASVKRMQGLFQSTLVAQGAFSLYRTEALRAVRGWPDAIGEDIVLTWRMMEQGGLIYFEPMAVSFTSAPETFKVFGRQRARWARGMIEGLQVVPPWKQKRGLARVFTAIDVAIPLLDTAYVFLWIPGLILACFGYFWIVGPLTLAVLPLTLAIYGTLLYYQVTRVFRPLGLRTRRDWSGLVLFVVVYQVFMSMFSVVGYFQELTHRKRNWK